MFSGSEFDEVWKKAEAKVLELLERIQPSGPLEKRRQDISDYVKDLIYQYFECQVFPFGSVPLKTYLPNGDIDISAFNGFQQTNEAWANELRSVLEREEKNPDSKFHVKEVQCIHAEVDHLIGRSHLFKRSIVLVKAWCYDESRILGAHHGLISTYALETLVLYIFNFFSTSLHGPLEVLFLFLDFFSIFDWERYCLSLWGPIPLSSLPEMNAEPAQKDEDKFLLSQCFLDCCSLVYGVIPGGKETHGRPFSRKFMNIVDPLRTSNNLGRSVSKGNLYRIQSAFLYGAKKLEKIPCGSQEELGDTLSAFFMNTKNHASGQRLDASISQMPFMQEEASHQQDEHASSNKATDFSTSYSKQEKFLMDDSFYCESVKDNINVEKDTFNISMGSISLAKLFNKDVSYCLVLDGERDVALEIGSIELVDCPTNTKGNEIPKLKNPVSALEMKEPNLKISMHLLFPKEGQARCSSQNNQHYALASSLRRTSSANMLHSFIASDVLEEANALKKLNSTRLMSLRRVSEKDYTGKIQRKGKEVVAEPWVQEEGPKIHVYNIEKPFVGRLDGMESWAPSFVTDSSLLVSSSEDIPVAKGSSHNANNLESSSISLQHVQASDSNVGIPPNISFTFNPCNPWNSLLNEYNTIDSYNMQQSKFTEGEPEHTYITHMYLFLLSKFYPLLLLKFTNVQKFEV